MSDLPTDSPPPTGSVEPINVMWPHRIIGEYYDEGTKVWRVVENRPGHGAAIVVFQLPDERDAEVVARMMNHFRINPDL